MMTKVSGTRRKKTLRRKIQNGENLINQNLFLQLGKKKAEPSPCLVGHLVHLVKPIGADRVLCLRT